MRNYVYKVKHKFLKKRADGSREIEDYFKKYISVPNDGVEVENDGDEYEIYSIGYLLKEDSALVRGVVNLLNDPNWQKEVGLLDENEEPVEVDSNLVSEDRVSKKSVRQEFEDAGMHFEEVRGEDGSVSLVFIEDQDSINEFRRIRVCVDTIYPDTRGLLFIPAPGMSFLNYYNSSILDKEVGDLINSLLSEGVIYKKVAPGGKKDKDRVGQA